MSGAVTRTAALLLAAAAVAAAQPLRATLDAPDRVTLHHLGTAEGGSLKGCLLFRVDGGAQGGPDTSLVAPGHLETVSLDGRTELRLSPLSSLALSLREQYVIRLGDGSLLPVIPDGIYPAVSDDLVLGHSVRGRVHHFRLYAPRAASVRVNLYTRPDDDRPARHLAAQPYPDGTWRVELPDPEGITAFTWSQSGPLGVDGWCDHEQEFADPFSRAVATRNTYGHTGRTLLEVPAYSWKNDRTKVRPHAGWILYEAHLRDLSAHPGSGAASPGSYAGFLDPAGRGGINHLKRLGITAVEFLPLQDFGNIELDYDSPETFIRNTWNPWERNHWGYMTSYFLAPESWYASDADHTPGAWCGVSGRQVTELKRVVDELHGAGIAVVMDVVYNHAAQYDENCFKRLDPCYWFHLDEQGRYRGASGCGNDLRTERPLLRRLILESLEHWVDEYHIDGFRFDLGAMIDDETLRQVHSLLERRGVFHTAEPWGGGEYEPALFAQLGWAWWNDIYRVDLRGRQPGEGQGFLFGSLHGESSLQRLELGVTGHPAAAGGFNASPLQAVNYVESHDDHTLSDWVRIALGKAKADERVPWEQRLDFWTLDEDELAIHTLAAFHLLTSAGMPMLHSGQELGRGKLIAPGPAAGDRAGHIDHNSYEKDDPTNWIDWDLARRNATLLENVSALCRYRVDHPSLATAPRRMIRPATPSSLAWQLEDGSLAVVINSSLAESLELELPLPMDLALHAGNVLLTGPGTLSLGPRSAALLERRPERKGANKP
jgi:pullulanase/glycogen debranching enzyme